MSSSPAPAQPQCPHFEVEAIDTGMAGALLAEKAATRAMVVAPFAKKGTVCEGGTYLYHFAFEGILSDTFFQTKVVSRVERVQRASCPGFLAARQG